MITGGLKRTIRKPVKTVLFLLLLIVTVTFLSIGVYLFSQTGKSLEEIEAVFRTVGTVEQKATLAKNVSTYDAVFDKYELSSYMDYDEPVKLEELNFSEANYIYPPENRPTLRAISPQFRTSSGMSEMGEDEVIEYEVVEIIEGIVPVRAKVVRALSGTYNEGQEVWICNHYGEDRFDFEIGKTYISFVQRDWVGFPDDRELHGIEELTNLAALMPYMPIYSLQIDKNGEYIEGDKYDEINWLGILEVTEDFYETEEGKRILHLVEQSKTFHNQTRCKPTNSLDLLMDFYDKNIYITSGREITQEEFDKGSPVCMVQADPAKYNGVEVGDKVSFSFISSLYGEALGSDFMTNSWFRKYGMYFDANGELYEPFFEQEYEVVGLYGSSAMQDYSDYQGNPFGIGYGTVIIPEKSVTASDENNMNDSLILKPYNTSFEIPNGTSGEYIEKIKELGLDEVLEINFYDGGYENIKSGISNMRQMSIILLLAGGITSLATLFFFTFIFVGKEKKSVAVERSLGMTRKKSAMSMLIGVMVIVVTGAGVGVTVGGVMSEKVYSTVQEMNEENAYDTSFSNWINIFTEEESLTAANLDEVEELENEAGQSSTIALNLRVLLCVIVSELVIAILFIRSNLKQEPIKLLSSQ